MITKEQKAIVDSYLTKSMLAINDPEKFDQIISDFEKWKAKEGITL